MAVSYTHLDVYKRQDVDIAQIFFAASQNSIPEAGLLTDHMEAVQMYLDVAGAYIFAVFHRVLGNVEEMGLKPVDALNTDVQIALGFGVFPYFSHAPVSYTHLDVYKRQYPGRALGRAGAAPAFQIRNHPAR